MARTVRLTQGNNRFTQGTNPNNVAVTVFGLGGKDTISLNRSDDLGGRCGVDAGSGNDTVLSFKEDGNAIILGTGNDTYVGRGFGSFSSERADTVLGGAGNDTFAFETFKSSYDGGADNDIFFSVGWQNTINGGDGLDTVSYEPRADDSTQGSTGVTINLTTQIVQTGGSRTETLISIENATGSANNDIIIGDNQANVLRGGGGLDAVQGGGGADRFVFAQASDAPVFSDFADQIVDFSRVQGDKIDLSLMDANTTLRNDQAFTFIGTAEFSGVKGSLRAVLNATNQMLVQGDINGDRQADFQFLVDGTSSLLASDFIL